MEPIWYVMLKEEKQGPMTIKQVAKMFNSGQISEDSLIWKNGLKQWQPLQEIMKVFQEFTQSKNLQVLFDSILKDNTDTEKEMALEDENNYVKCKEAIQNSQAMVIATGAGMGVDSGLPDFRGKNGWYNGYSEDLGINILDIANPYTFLENPKLGWGYYGLRMQEFNESQPHQGFYILKEWISRYKLDYFTFTSNIDRHFQKAGFCDEKVYEKHGSIHHLQCLTPCSEQIWENKQEISIDESMDALSTPLCPQCNKTARPNILMFGDFSWIPHRSEAQYKKFKNFLGQHKDSQIVAIEIGAGTVIPSIRRMSENIGSSYKATVIRINPNEPQIHVPHIPLRAGGLEALKKIESVLVR